MLCGAQGVSPAAASERTLAAPSRPAILALNPGGIPTDLLGMKAWIGWRLELRNGRDGLVWSKIPINLTSGKFAKSNDPTTWCDFGAALLEHKRRGCDGIAFCRTADLLLIDLDGCLDAAGRLLPYGWARETLDRLTGRAYIERSVCGRGLHAIVRCASLPGTRVQLEQPGQKHCGCVLRQGALLRDVGGVVGRAARHTR
jgi:hypothetical protein